MRQNIPEQEPKSRIKNFEEVALGYTEEQAVREASRCLNCKKASCTAGCPVEIDIPAFITLIKEKKFKEAAQKLKEKNNLPAVCGRVCPQEDQCEKLCVLSKKGTSINIGGLERFAADWELKHSPQPAVHSPRPTAQSQRSKVAVIGSGPAGLTCAADLAKMGYDVTLLESLSKAGGVLVYGIPEFRLPKKIVEQEVDFIKSLGVKLEVNMLIGKSVTIEELRDEGFRAFFIATGAGLPYFLGIEGEILNGVYSANEFLTRVNLMKAYLFPGHDTPVRVGKKVAVIGAGNVAMDSARCALRLGAKEVTIVYRRTENEMPARQEEIVRAREEGIKFELLTNPTRIFGDENGWVKSMECLRNELGEADDSGRRRPVPIKGSEFIMGTDTVICAIGQGPNPLLLSTMPDLKLTKKGTVDADHSHGQTSIADVFAGGDIVTGASTVISAMGIGKRAARAMDEYLRDKKG